MPAPAPAPPAPASTLPPTLPLALPVVPPSLPPSTFVLARAWTGAEARALSGINMPDSLGCAFTLRSCLSDAIVKQPRFLPVIPGYAEGMESRCRRRTCLWIPGSRFARPRMTGKPTLRRPYCLRRGVRLCSPPPRGQALFPSLQRGNGAPHPAPSSRRPRDDARCRARRDQCKCA